ncbi:hypothetical protein M405DRAFT_813168 [Rhizopogon salebrosus TDB-379]|nr:hypothetical protein M405DRAFT_813168 [Rhizopogon salebrosus TDB-379]
MDNYELDSFSPANRLSPNRGPPTSIPLLYPNSSHTSHVVPSQWQEDHTYIPYSVTDEPDPAFSPVHKLSPNRGPPTSMPLLDSQQSLLVPNRWRGSNHRTPRYKRQVMSFIERLLALAKLSALPLLASAYLAFCAIAHSRLIALKSFGSYTFTPEHIATIKAGVTSLSQLVIFAAIYPVYDIVSQLQSEEFFRTLSARGMRGIPLATLDEMSNPNYGSMKSLNEVISRSSSIYMSSAFVATLISVAITLVTPATLDVATVLVEKEVVALAVGAIPAQSVYNASSPAQGLLGFQATENAAFAASVLWSEMELGANYSFSAVTSDAEFAAYIVPSPIDLPTTASAHWMTDVIGINPSCAWASTNITTPIQLQGNQSDPLDASAGVYLENLDLDVTITGIIDDLSALNIGVVDPYYAVFNHSTQAPPTDGSTVFTISQCVTGCDNLTLFDPVVLNLTNIPTFTLDKNATELEQAETWNVAFLACRPNAVIQTREVISNGTGFLEVLPVQNGKHYSPQGNLHPTQSPAMLSFALSGISLYAGPTNLSISSAGSFTTVQADFLFGQEQVDALPPVGYTGPPMSVTILPTDILTPKFATLLQSASKSYLAGYLGTAYVPAKLFSSQVVFVSSMPFIIASTVMFGMLFILMVIMHFRRDGKSFNLVSVSAALHGSNLPNYFSRMGKSRVFVVDGDHRVVLQKGEDGMSVLQIVNNSGGTDK